MTPTRIAIATDAWHPQVNGVVTTLERTAAELGALGFEVLVLNPGLFRTVPCPSYPSIRLAIAPWRVVAARLSEFAPHAVHIAIRAIKAFWTPLAPSPCTSEGSPSKRTWRRSCPWPCWAASSWSETAGPRETRPSLSRGALRRVPAW